MELDLRQIFDLILKKFWVIVISAVAFSLAALIYCQFIATPMYSAKTSMYVYNTYQKEGTITTSELSVAKSLVNTYIQIFKSRTVLQKVADELDLGYSAGAIGRMFSAASLGGTEIFEVTITSPNPAHSMLIANKIAEIGGQEILRIVKAGSFSVVDPASVPASPSSPNTVRTTVLAAFIGIILAVSIIILNEMVDNHVKSEEDITAITSVPIVGIIPIFEVSSDSSSGQPPSKKQASKEGK